MMVIFLVMRHGNGKLIVKSRRPPANPFAYFGRFFAQPRLVTGSIFLIQLDVSAGLPFLLAVTPSERIELSATYSDYRDVSGIITPGAAWLVLLVAPLSAVFAAGGAGLLGKWILAHKLHRRLGLSGIAVEGGPGQHAHLVSESTAAQRV